jgi:hypothetical protein
MSIYYLLGTKVSTLHRLTQLILATTLQRAIITIILPKKIEPQRGNLSKATG